jgi:hypothetical protein
MKMLLAKNWPKVSWRLSRRPVGTALGSLRDLGFESGVLVGRGNRAKEVKAAIESTSPIRVNLKDPEQEIELMFLGVGINSY